MAEMFGSGVLAEAIAAALRDAPAGPPVVVTERGDEARLETVRAAGGPVLPVVVEPDVVLIGPAERPGRAGCAECARTRRMLADDDPAAHRELARSPAGVPALLTAQAARLVAVLVARERLACNESVQLSVNLRALTVSTHPVLAVTGCPVCGSGEPAVVSCVDGSAGMVRTGRTSFDGTVFTATARATARPGAAEVSGRGYGGTPEQAEERAVLETLNALPSEPSVVARGSAAAVSATLDPGLCGLDPDGEHAWVTGFSYAAEAPVLVPTGFPGRRGLGRTHEEALHRGLLDVLATDAALSAWHAGRPVGRVALSGGQAVLAAAVGSWLGDRRVRVFDTTPEHGVPCVLAVATQSTVEDDPGPFAVCAAAADADRDRAVRRALRELHVAGATLGERFQSEAGHAARLAADPTLVRTPTDHPLRHASPDLAPRWRFLTDTDLRAGDRNPLPDQDVLPRVLGSGLDVLTVDDTVPEHRAAGFLRLRVLLAGVPSRIATHLDPHPLSNTHP